MYILEVNYGNGEIHRHFLLPDQTYTLGRKECRILLPAAEPSISRHHATIFVASMPRYKVLDPSAELEIRVEDVSKHGTFVDGERIGKDNSRFLYPEDRIRLGLRVTAWIIPVVLVVAISPDLTDEHLDVVLEAAVRTGSLVVEDSIPDPLAYYEEHTSCIGFLYVAEEAFRVEETMMTALGYGYTLVTPEYIAHLVRCIEKKDTLMPGEFPLPSSPSPASRALRSVSYRRPAQTYYAVTEFLSTGRPKAAMVFRGGSFVLLDGSLEKTYSGVLRLFGASVERVALDNVPAWCSRQSSSQPFPLTTVVLVGDTDFHCVSEEVMKRGGGHGMFPTKHARPLVCGYLTMYKYGVCLIPEDNVHLALYCNDPGELNTKATSCYLQRITDDVLSDESLLPGSDGGVRLSGRASTDVHMAGRRGSTARLSESHKNASLSPGVKIERVPLIARRSREASYTPSRSPSRSEMDGNVTSAPSSLSIALSTTTTSLAEGVQSGTGSRCFSPANGTCLTTVDSAVHAFVPPRALHEVPTASFSDTAECSSEHNPALPSTSAPALLSPAAVKEASPAPGEVSLAPISSDTSVATLTPSSSTALDSGSSSDSPARLKGGMTEASSAPATTASHGTTATQRYSHPFSLSSRLRNRNPGGLGGRRAEQSGADAALDAEGTGVLKARQHSSSSSMHPSITTRPSSGDYTSSMPPPRSEEEQTVCCRTGSMSTGSTSAAAGAAARSLSCASVDGLQPSGLHEASEKPLRCSAHEQLDCNEDIRDTMGTPPSCVTEPLPPSSSAASSARLVTTVSVTATGPSVECVAQSNRVPLESARAVAVARPELAMLKSQRTSSRDAAAVSKHTEAPREQFSVRRGEQRLSGAAASARRCGAERQSTALLRLHSWGPHEGLQSTMLERDVVVHAASQVGKSPPRQRVEAVPVRSVSRSRKSSLHDSRRFISRLGEASGDGAGKTGGRQSDLGREALRSANQPPPAGSTSLPVAQEASLSFERFNSLILRDMATPNRLTTPRMGNSARRIRCAQAYGSLPIHPSPCIPEDGAALRRSTSDFAESRVRKASARHSSACGRRGSSTHSNRSFSRAASSSNLSVSGQVSLGRSDSVAAAGVITSSTTAESYVLMNNELSCHCESFMSDFLNQFMSEMERKTRFVVQQTYMDPQSKQIFEDGMERIYEVLQYIKATESDIPAMYSTSRTRAACHQARQKSQYTLSKIRSCYSTVHCRTPSVLMRARAVLSTRATHAHHPKRRNSVTREA